MANRKISDLTALTTPATGDLLPIVDISEAAAADKNKKITIQSLFQGIPVNVGIGTTSPGGTLDIKAAASTAPLIVQGPSSEFARTDSSGRLLVGTSSARANYYNSTGFAQFQIEGTSFNESSLSITTNNTVPANAGNIIINKSAGASIGSNTLVADGELIGGISWQGNDGAQFVLAAVISAYVDGTPGANDMPGRLVFSVTADGATSPTEAMRIKSTRIINFSNAPTYADNTAATAGGLAVGDVYKTVLGVLMIRF